MILAIDVGNTNIKASIIDGDEYSNIFRLTTSTNRTSDEYGQSLLFYLENNGLSVDDIDGAVISSVVPAAMHSLVNSIKKYFKIDPLIVGVGIKTGIRVDTENPKEVGSDRIADACGAYFSYGGPILVIDFGTATKYDVVDEGGAFTVGITSSGIRITANALWENTAKLPEIEIKKPKSILAKNTITSLQAGLVYGYIGQVEYIVSKVKEELGLPDMKVVSTGGLSRIIVDETDVIDFNDPYLTFKGLNEIYKRNS